jgi:hypothetical protein
LSELSFGGMSSQLVAITDDGNRGPFSAEAEQNASIFSSTVAVKSFQRCKEDFNCGHCGYLEEVRCPLR